MAKQTPSPTLSEPALPEIDLKDPRVAAFLAWLLPGLGHFYQGRMGKSVLFFVCIIGTFVYGMYIGEGRVVYASQSPFARWQYFCQLGVGLPALPAIVQRNRVMHGKQALFGGEFMRPPRLQGDFRSADQTDQHNEVLHPDELAQWNHDMGDRFEIGTVFTVIAGLLNVLVIYDAYGGPLIILPPDDKKKRGNGDDDPDGEDKQ